MARQKRVTKPPFVGSAGGADSPSRAGRTDRKQRVIVAMSGGVDSSVAAALLVEAGYDVVGVAMRLWESGTQGTSSGCCSLDDFLDARLVAEQLKIPFYVMDFRDQFRRAVVDDFVAEYRRGRTPNPCTRCNQFVKFATFWERARALGADLIATGHYARLRPGPDGVQLLRGVDEEKDQSYFLFAVDHTMLHRIRFPVGELCKAEVRCEATRRGLAVADKPESQEVCFAPRGAYATFVEQQESRVPLRAGSVTDTSGRVVAQHQGIHRFTIGQRRGLGIGLGGPAQYVTAIDANAGVIQVGPSEHLLSPGLVAAGVNWLGPPPRPGDAVTIKIRSRFPPQPAVVHRVTSDQFTVVAEHGLRAATPGQAAVLYDGERVLGGAWISCCLPGATAEPRVGARSEDGELVATNSR